MLDSEDEDSAGEEDEEQDVEEQEVADFDDSINVAESDRQLLDQGRALLQKRTERLIYTDRNLSYLRKVEISLEVLHASEHRMPQKQDQQPSIPTFATIFNQPPENGSAQYEIKYNGRKPYNMMSRSSKPGRLVYCFLVGSDGKDVKCYFKNQANITFTDWHSTDLEGLMKLMCNFYNAWPEAAAFDDNFKRNVVRAAVGVYKPQSPQIKMPNRTKNHGFTINIPDYDTDHEEIREFNRYTYTLVSMDCTLPNLPQDAELYTKAPRWRHYCHQTRRGWMARIDSAYGWRHLQGPCLDLTRRYGSHNEGSAPCS